MFSRIALLVLSVLAIARSQAAEVSAPPVREISPGVYEIGKIRLDANRRRIEIPALVNMLEGPVEYVLVNAMGKVHESIFKTDADALHVHTAALLLLKEPISSSAPPKLRISVELPGGKIVSADSLVLDATAKKPLDTGNWNYRGSRVVDGTFIAQRDGSIISIIADPDTLIESGRIGADDDDRWRPNKAQLPPAGAAVKVLIEFPKNGTGGAPNAK